MTPPRNDATVKVEAPRRGDPPTEPSTGLLRGAPLHRDEEAEAVDLEDPGFDRLMVEVGLLNNLACAILRPPQPA